MAGNMERVVANLPGRIVSFRPEATSLEGVGIGEYPLEGRVQRILARGAPACWKSTGLDRGLYFGVMERVVGQARGWVDEQGAVLDPVVGRECGQSSPRFTSSAAILLHFGRMPELKDTVCKTMSYCCRRMESGAAKDYSPDFWTRELATAYMALETVADRVQLDEWRARLGSFQPESFYKQVTPDGEGIESLHNWTVYSSAGEYLREVAGLGPRQEADWLWGRAFFDKYMRHQIKHMTACGMYRDPGDPITYDITTRLQMATALAFGYGGDLRAPIEELLRRGGLSMLLFVSPEGYVPYGGRSAQFNFQETIIAALCELEARRYKAADPLLAGAFKRQARLSTLAMTRWVMDMEPFRHIKNGFPPDRSHGLDSYGNYSVYSALTSSFLGLAAIFADDTIPEAPAPAEIGGYALEFAPAFHKVFANCAGSYIEIDTAADAHYDATGLGRVVARGVPLELGLGMAFAAAAEKWGARAISMAPGVEQPEEPVAIGPLWPASGKWVSLAAMSQDLEPELEVIAESPDAVEFEVAYSCAGGESRVLERYRLTEGKLRINTRVLVGGKLAERMRFVVPLLVTDGSSTSEIKEKVGRVVVAFLGASCTVAFGEGVAATVEDPTYANRNAVYRSLVLEPAGGEISVELSLAR